jgi:hypothetical protein
MTAFRQKHAALNKVNNATLAPWIDEAFLQYPVLQTWFNTLNSMRKRKNNAQRTPAAIIATNKKKKQLQDSINTHEHRSFLQVCTRIF